jgi:hypothetical protein
MRSKSHHNRRSLTAALVSTCAISAGLAATAPAALATGCGTKQVGGTINAPSLSIKLCKDYLVTSSLKINASGNVQIDKPILLAPGAGLTIDAKGKLTIDAPIGPAHANMHTSDARISDGRCLTPGGIDLNASAESIGKPVQAASGGTNADGDGCRGGSVRITATSGKASIWARVTGGNGGPGKSDLPGAAGTFGACHAAGLGKPQKMTGGWGGAGGSVYVYGEHGDLSAAASFYIYAGDGGAGGSVWNVAPPTPASDGGMGVSDKPGDGGPGGDALLFQASGSQPFGHPGAGGAPGDAMASAGDGGAPNCGGGDSYVNVAKTGQFGEGSYMPVRTRRANVTIHGGNAFGAPLTPPGYPLAGLLGGAGGDVEILGGTATAAAPKGIAAYLNRLQISNAGNGGPGGDGCSLTPQVGGNGGAGGMLQWFQGGADSISVDDATTSQIASSFNGNKGGDGGGYGHGGSPGATPGKNIPTTGSFNPGIAGNTCPATGTGTGGTGTPGSGTGSVNQTGYNLIPSGGHSAPVDGTPGPTSGDVLVALQGTDDVLAVNGSSGALDTSVGGGVLPLPSDFPTSDDTSVEGVTFAGGAIYATFLDSTMNMVFVTGWTPSGQLETGFGDGGLVGIPSVTGHSQWTNVGKPVVSGSELILPATNANAPGVTLIPVNTGTGVVGTPVTTAAPTGTSILQRGIALGPDGKLYVTGTEINDNTAAESGFAAVFDAASLQSLSSNTFAAPNGVGANTLAFWNGEAWVGFTGRGTGTTSTANVASFPLGNTATVITATLPTMVSGTGQTLFGLEAGTAGLTVGVNSFGATSDSEWLVPLTGSTFGSPVQLTGPLPSSAATVLLPVGGGGIALGDQSSQGAVQDWLTPFTQH